MNIDIIIDEKATDLDIKITCNKLIPDIEKFLAMLRMMNHQITGKKDNEIYLLDISEVIYIESVERRCFIYTSNDIYESELKLYELENQLVKYSFFKVSKSFLINLKSIRSLKADINRKIRVTMLNGEQIIASRQYADELKERIGVK